jgi:hypothetical protein
MAKTGNQRYQYANPDPFITPVVEERAQDIGALGSVGGFFVSAIPAELFQHDQLMYSGPIIENIMFHISLENEFRGGERLQWKAYKTGELDFDTFIAGGSRLRANPFPGAVSLQQYPVKFFSFYIRDMQAEIEELVSNSRYPDSIASLMARIFLNKTTHTGAEEWDGTNRLPNTLRVPSAAANNSDDNDGVDVLNPFDNITGTWAFPQDTDHVQECIPRIGIDFKGEGYVTRSDIGVTTSDTPNKSNFEGNSKLQWPRSVVGKRRQQEGLTIEDGFIEEKEGSIIDGIDAIHMPGVPADRIDEGRQEQFRQLAEEDAVLPGAVGKPDLQSGYSFFSHHPHVLQQLRYQPPHVETWDNTTEVRDWVENLFSNLTPNLPWYFSQPVEKLHFSDWGGWLIQGLGGLTGPGMRFEAYADPQYNNITTNCPFSVFFPPSSSTCACGAANTAYGIWSSSSEPLIWNEQLVSNELTNSGAAKQFGPKTRLILDASFALGEGTGSNGGAGWFLGIRTSRISSVNLQPFVPVMGLATGGVDFGNIFSNSMNINLMDAMASFYPWYEKDGIDSILSIGIFVRTQTGETRVVAAEDGPGGSFIPATDLGCSIGTSTAVCTKLYLFEPPWEGLGDIRTPPDFEHGTIEDPPEYNLPIIS